MKGGGFKSPINGALIAVALSHPGVNAWLEKKAYDELSYHPHRKALDIGLSAVVTTEQA